MNQDQDNDENSPDIHGCGGRLKQRTSSLMKRASVKYSHRSNFADSNNMTLQAEKSDSVMPQKTYIFWILIFIIFFMAAVNFLLLVIMMNVLSIGEGMESMEMVNKEDIVKFFGDVDFDNVVYDKAKLEGFQNIPMHISGNDGTVLMSVQDPDTMASSDKLKVDRDEILLSKVEKFDVVDPNTGKNIFSTDDKDFVIPKGVSRLDVKKLYVKRLISPLDSNLTVKPDTGVTRLRGNEGVSIEGREILFRADGDIYLNSVYDGNINFLSNEIKISNMPRTSGSRTFMNSYQSTQKYKLCVCMPQGILFQVLVPKNVESHKACSYVHPHKSPCANDDQGDVSFSG